MILNEFWQQSTENMQDVGDDQSQIKQSDTRKTRLTLRQINKLRRMNDLRSTEYKDKLKQIKKQYAQPAPQPQM